MNMFGYTSVSSAGDAGMKGGDIDLESGEMLYPGIGHGENQLRWGFIRKVYGILTAQILMTTVVSAATVLYTPINDLLRGNSGFLLFLIFTPFICLLKARLRRKARRKKDRSPFNPAGGRPQPGARLGAPRYALVRLRRAPRLAPCASGDGSPNRLVLWPLYVYQQKHPLNFIFLGLFTASLSLTVGVSCANTEGRIVLEALILTSAVVLALTGYTFWAAKKGKDFSFLGPILFTSLFILVLTGFIQVFFPFGSSSVAIYSAVSAIIFSGYIVYDTDNLIKRFTYDQYIWASVTLYLDVLNLFLTILRMLKQDN
ncbi:hypothetical protein OROHE_017940 [Orobanche hederae]